MSLESLIELIVKFLLWANESGGERILSPLDLGALVLVIICWSIFAFMYLFLRAYDAHHHLAPARGVEEKNNSFRVLYIFVGGSIIAEISNMLVNNNESLEIGSIFTKWFDISPEVNAYVYPIFTTSAVVCVAYGLLMVVRGRIALDGFWGPEIYTYEPKGTALRDYELIKSGVYRYMRHPIYCGQIIMAVATSFALNNGLIFVLSIALIISNCLRYKKEDRYLHKTFKKEWETWSHALYAFGFMPIKFKKEEPKKVALQVNN